MIFAVDTHLFWVYGLCFYIDTKIEDELLSILNKGDFQKAVELAINFQNKYVTVFGKATEKAITKAMAKIPNGVR